jgi:hypothetical protein
MSANAVVMRARIIKCADYERPFGLPLDLAHPGSVEQRVQRSQAHAAFSEARPEADFGQQPVGHLRWLDRHERQSFEQPPLGIILCAGKKRETVEYLDKGRKK